MNDFVITVTLIVAGITATGTLLTGIAAIITARKKKTDETVDK